MTAIGAVQRKAGDIPIVGACDRSCGDAPGEYRRLDEPYPLSGAFFDGYSFMRAHMGAKMPYDKNEEL